MLHRLRTFFGAGAALLASDDAAANALIDQGNALDEADQPDAALSRYQAALAIAPRFARVHLNLGNSWLARGDVGAAIAAYETALQHQPAHAGARFNLGHAFAQQGEAGRALAEYERALQIDPAFVDAHVARGVALESLGRPSDAVMAYEAAIALRPDHAPVHSNRGGALRSAGRFIEAIEAQRRAIALDAALTQAHNNLGSVLKDVGALDEAEASFRRALALRPGDSDAHSNLLFLHNFRARYTPAELRSEAEAFGRIVAARARPFSQWQGTREAGRLLRIGWVSGDLRAHPVGYFLESVLAALAAGSAGRLRLIAYATARCDDPLTQRLKSCFDEWREVQGVSDQALARQVHADAIDILIDLSGHTGHNRLPVFAWKPSPVQLTWLGYFATTGVAEVDYLLADPTTLPEALAASFSEQIWRLPETRLCFSAPELSPEVAPLPAAREGHITFGCFNQLSKLGDEVIALWARVLGAVPRSRLLLKSPPLREPMLQASMSARFAAHGIGADRLTMEGLSARGDYLARHAAVDIALDPFTFTGGTTSAEALWMGVPVLTLAGTSFLARQGVGLLTNLGLDDWIATDADDVVRIAVSKSSDITALQALRGSLRERMRTSPLMDAPRFAQHLETALRGIWTQHCKPV